MFNILKGQENLSLRTKIRQQHKNYRDPISPKELTESELRLLKWCQQTIDVDKLDKKLIPSKDEHGLLRAHGRLENIRTLPDEMRNPIILPKSHRLVELLLVHLHGKRAHCGYKSLIYESRKRFWIVGVRHMAKHLTGKCVTCKKLRKEPFEQLMGQIPKLRVAARASHLNGIVESLIKSVRQALDATDKNQALTEEQWRTYLAEVTCLINIVLSTQAHTGFGKVCLSRQMMSV